VPSSTVSLANTTKPSRGWRRSRRDGKLAAVEILVDERLVGAIVAAELQQARTDIEQLGPIAAYENSRQRHDARLSAAAAAPTLACKSGCFWCCYFTVDVRAVEVFSILDFMKRELTAAEQARVWREIEANSALLHGLDPMERMRRNVKCPFLAEGRCSIYS